MTKNSRAHMGDVGTVGDEMMLFPSAATRPLLEQGRIVFSVAPPGPDSADACLCAAARRAHRMLDDTTVPFYVLTGDKSGPFAALAAEAAASWRLGRRARMPPAGARARGLSTAAAPSLPAQPSLPPRPLTEATVWLEFCCTSAPMCLHSRPKQTLCLIALIHDGVCVCEPFK